MGARVALALVLIAGLAASVLSTAEPVAAQTPDPHLEVVVRAFVPSQVYKLSGHDHLSGDDRGPAYWGGTSRVDIAFELDPETGQLLTEPTIIGAFTLVWPNWSTAWVLGKPFWWHELTTNFIPDGYGYKISDIPGWIEPSFEPMSVGDSTGQRLSFGFAVDLDGEIRVSSQIDVLISEYERFEDGSSQAVVTVAGEHDSFPSFEVYVSPDRPELVHYHAAETPFLQSTPFERIHFDTSQLLEFHAPFDPAIDDNDPPRGNGDGGLGSRPGEGGSGGTSHPGGSGAGAGAGSGGGGATTTYDCDGETWEIPDTPQGHTDAAEKCDRESDPDIT